MNEQFDRKPDNVYSKRLKAGKRRTYFFDVRATRGNDYFLTITESRKRQNDDGYDRHKIFLYKEDFHKFQKGLDDAITHVKTELMPDFNFDSFNHEQEEWDGVVLPQTASIDLLPQTAEVAGQPFPEPVATESIAGNNIIDGTKREGFYNTPEPAQPVEEVQAVPQPAFTEEVDKW